MYDAFTLSAVMLARSYPRHVPEYALSVVTPPPVEPVQYADMAEYLRLDQTDDQALVTALAVAGRRYVEEMTRSTLVATTYSVSFNCFDPYHGMRLPRRPVTGVTSVTYLDQNGVTQTLPANQYQLDTKLYTRLRPIPGGVFPTTQLGQANSVTITFTAGASPDGTNVDPLALLAIKSWAAAVYENREAVNTGKTGSVLPHSFDAIIGLLSAPEVC